MYFDSWNGFLAMEGHGLYVWSAYAVAVIVIAYNLISPFMAKRQVVAQVRRQERLVKRKVIVNDFKVTTDSGDDMEPRFANPGSTQQKHRAERQEESPESVERSAQ
ncbi:heme exporter protein CcmD [Endozoicomonas sp.]|uniref:heme exporter protein CcmD n=1 Tax=Endozoicomonas sp. TaxID=1892382 RepID=UPI003AF40E49